MGEKAIIEQLAQFACQESFKTIPDETLASSHSRVLDILGICIAATELDTSKAVIRYSVGQGGAEQAHAVLTSQALPAPLAALVNGTLAHSLDYDDTHLPSVLHPSATIIPACLAAGEMVKASGKEVISAIATGLEVCVRLGMAGYDKKARNSIYFDRGQHATSICGAIAAAGSAAKLMGLDAAGVGNAMSIACSMASGIIESNRTGGTIKRLHCGWAAHSAVSAASLAQLGFTGAPSALEGRFGLFRALLGGKFDKEALLEGLGTIWSVPSIYFKPYPANHFTHAGIDAAMALRARGVRPEQVEALRLGVAGPVIHTVGEPIEAKRNPKTGYQAQFSGPYTVVAGLLGGHGLGVGLDDFTDELAVDPWRRELMSRVKVVEDPQCTLAFPDSFGAVLTAKLTDGTEITERVQESRGGPNRPLSEEEIAVKFYDNASRVLAAQSAAALEATIWSLGDLEDISPCLAPRATPKGLKS